MYVMSILNESQVPQKKMISNFEPQGKRRVNEPDIVHLLLRPRSELYGTVNNPPTLQVDSHPTRPVTPIRQWSLRDHRNQTPFFYTESESESGEELVKLRARTIQTKHKQSNRPKDPTEELRAFEGQDILSCLPIANSPRRSSLVSRRRDANAKSGAKGKEKAAVSVSMVSKETRSPHTDTRASNKRPSPQCPSTSSRGRSTKRQKTEDKIDEIVEAKGGSSKMDVILIDSDSEDDIPLAHPLSRRSEVQDPKVKEEAPMIRKSFFSGLGRPLSDKNLAKSPGKSKDEKPDKTAGDHTSETFEDRDNLAEIPVAGLEVAQHAQNKAELDKKTKRVKELEEELAQTKRDHESAIDLLRREHSIQLHQSKQDLKSANDALRGRHEAELQQTKETLRREHESRLQQTKETLDNLQQTVAEEVKESSSQIAALEAENTSLKAENQSLKGQLDKAREEVVKSLDQREMFVNTDASVKVLEGKIAAQAEEIELLKKRQRSEEVGAPQPVFAFTKFSPPPTPTPTNASFPSDISEQTKSDNIRKVYVKIKRKYDILRSVSVKIVALTHSMDLGSFGEFGMHLKSLKAAVVETDGKDIEVDNGNGGEGKG
ncbi:hypothetical protein N0V90_010352 [Kalmusia sp. IMI 367209]|nr:hypothetical protein N0V90_010352 [Kalmusia sp. IMI 367209]